MTLDLLGGESSLGYTEDGCINLELSLIAPVCISFGELGEAVQYLKKNSIFTGRRYRTQLRLKPLHYTPFFLADSTDLGQFTSYCQTDCLMSTVFHRPDFSGYMKYEAILSLPPAEEGRLELDFGQVGQTARVILNGRDCGMRICPPYRFDITDAACSGGESSGGCSGQYSGQPFKDHHSAFCSDSAIRSVGTGDSLEGGVQNCEMCRHFSLEATEKGYNVRMRHR